MSSTPARYSKFDGSVTEFTTLRSPVGLIRSLAWSPDGKSIFASADGGVCLWNLANGHVMFQGLISRKVVTDVSWSPNGRYLACSTEGGELIIWNAFKYEVQASLPLSDGSLKCLRWSPNGSTLALAGLDNQLYVVHCPAGQIQDTLTAFGHKSAALSLAWSPDGRSFISGTENGMVGVWLHGKRDCELRDFLAGADPDPDPKAHLEKVVDVAWSKQADVAASLSLDGVIHFWNVETRAHKGSFNTDQATFSIDFSPDGRILVARTRDRICFIDSDRKELIYSIECLANGNRGYITIHGESRMIAAEDFRDVSTIKVWRADFDHLIKASRIVKRRLRTAKIVVIGSPGSGKTSLANALAGPAIVGTKDSELRVHKLRLGQFPSNDGSILEIRDLVIWDLPSCENDSLLQKFYLEDLDPIMFVFDWSTIFSIFGGREHSPLATADRKYRMLIVGAKADLSRRSADEKTLRDLECQLGSYPISTRIDDPNTITILKESVAKLINWDEAATIDELEILEDVSAFIEKTRVQFGIASQSFLYSLFTASLLEYQRPSFPAFRSVLKTLARLGQVWLFKCSDDVLLRPFLFKAYAIGLLKAAEREDHDSKEQLGRIARERIYDSDLRDWARAINRLSDLNQEDTLVDRVVNEFKKCKIAYELSTFNKGFLVIPSKAEGGLPVLTPDNELAVTFRWRVAAFESSRDVFSSLVVQASSLNFQFKKVEPFRDAAVFSPTSGGRCTLLFEAGETSAGIVRSYFDDEVTGEAQIAFLNMVKDHLGVGTRGEPQCEEAASFSQKVSKERIFASCEPHDLHWLQMEVNPALEEKRIQFWTEDALPGATVEEKLVEKTKVRVAIFVVSQRELGEHQINDLATLGGAYRRIIPLIPHHVPDSFVLPDKLKRYEPIDFRRNDQNPCDLLAKTIRSALDQTRVDIEKMKLHAFISYCHDDKAEVQDLCSELEREGFDIWWDRRLLPGQTISEAIHVAMQKSYAVVVCLSSNLQMRYESGVLEELRDAIAFVRRSHPGSCRLIPIRLTACEPPEIELSPGIWLSGLKIANIFGSEREEALETLKEALRAASERSQSHRKNF